MTSEENNSGIPGNITITTSEAMAPTKTMTMTGETAAKEESDSTSNVFDSGEGEAGAAVKEKAEENGAAEARSTTGSSVVQAGEHRSEAISLSRNRRQSMYASLKGFAPVTTQIQLFSPPRQRQKWGSDQILPHVDWGNLFFDLFYVAGFYNLGNTLVDNPSPIGILYFAGCFFPVLQLWNAKTWYDGKFVYGDDLFHKMFETAVLVLLGSTVSYIGPVSRMSNPAHYVDMFGFSLCCSLSSFLNVFRRIETMLYGRGQRSNIVFDSKIDSAYHFIPMLFYLGAAIISGNAYFASDEHYDEKTGDYDTYDKNGADYDTAYVTDAADYDKYDEKLRFLAAASSAETVCDDSNTMHLPIVLLLLGYVTCQVAISGMVLFIMPKMKNLGQLTIPMNVGFFIHRMGELTMLLLGESVLSLLIVDGKKGEYYASFYFGVTTVIVLQLLHFRSQPHDANAHALRRSRVAAMLYFNTFYIYSSVLIAVGASYKMFLYSLKDEKRRFLLTAIGGNDGHDHRWLAGGGSDYGCGPTGEERKQNIAYLFSGALSILFFTLDIMTLSHVGLEKALKQVQSHCKHSGEESDATHKNGRYNLKALFFVALPRIGITFFVATLGLWQTEPPYLAAFGLAAVLGQLMIRFLGNLFIHPEDQHHHEHGHHHEGVEDEESDH